MNLLRRFSSTIRFNHLILSPFYRQTHLKSSTSERVPEWSQPENESTDIKRRRLLYQSRKRGMLENDLLISNFASIYLPKMNEKDLDIYDKLINTPSNDWDLYYMAIDKMETPPEYQNHIMDLFKEYVKNDKKQARLRQPDLVPV